MTPPRSDTYLTARDMAVLHTLGIARLLTIPALEWLHWPSWAARWAAAQQRQDAYYKPSTRAYTRLAALRRAGYVQRFARAVADGTATVRREADAYALTERGAERLRAAGRWEPGMIWLPRRERSVQHLAHSVAIGQTYAALHAKAQTMPGRTITGWMTDAALDRSPADTVRVITRTATGGVQAVTVPVRPDATAELRSTRGAMRVFVEVDRGRSMASWADKVRAYQAYQDSAAVRARYGVSSFVLLCVTTTEAQRRQMLQATAQVIGQASDRYLFGLIDDIHPTTIGDCWQKLGVVERTAQQSLRGSIITHYTVTPAPHVVLS